MLELVKNFERFTDINFAIGSVVRGVAELAETSMACARVVPTVGGFFAKFFGHLVELDAKRGI